MHPLSLSSSRALFRWNRPSLLLAAVSLALTVGLRAQTATLTNINSLTSTIGIHPPAAPIQGADGAFYGTTTYGGTDGFGTVYRRAANGVVTVLHAFRFNRATRSFFDGANPNTPLVQGPDGLFYGVTPSGGTLGAGTVFKVSADGTNFTVLHTFQFNVDGGSSSALIVGRDGNLYGMTSNGGPTGANSGTIFSLSIDGTTSTVLYSFDPAVTGGGVPSALVQGPDGTFYGTRASGGSGNGGTLFKFTVVNGTATPVVLRSFGVNADGPQGNLVLDNGMLYGATLNRNGGSQYGAIYAVSTDGSAVVDPLYSFADNSSGSSPTGGLTLANGRLFGITSAGGSNGYGTVFSLAEDGTGLTLVHGFTGTDGRNSNSALTLGTDGTLYGTTPNGGAASADESIYSDNGTIFQVSQDGSAFNTLFNFFVDNAYPTAGLISGPDGTFYGTTSDGGPADAGTVFRVDANGVLTTLHQFAGTDGASPNASLLLGPGGYLYGTTQSGGNTNDPANNGTVFRLLPDGTNFSVVHNFISATDGTLVEAALIQGTDGFLYGAAQGGGANNQGTIFKVSATGTSFTNLHSFSRFVDGAFPVAGVVQGPDGFLYGVTRRGGNTNNNGTIFKLSTDGTIFTLLRFLNYGTDGAQPAGALALGPDGLFYGTTQIGGTSNGQGGTVFRISADGTTFAVLHSFDGTGNGSQNIQSGLLLSKDGFFYGTTTGDGDEGRGIVFRLSTAGDFAPLFSFNADYNFNTGTFPNPAIGGLANLIEGADGFLYGTSAGLGLAGDGSVYRLTVSPVVNNVNLVGQVGVALSFQVPAFHHPTAFAATGLPAGLNIDAATGIIAGTPTTVGTSTGTLTASNAIDQTTASFSVTIQPPAPVVTSGALPAGQVGVGYGYQVTASNAPTAFSASGLPTGLTVDPGTGLVSGTPTAAGNFTVVFSASNGGGTGSMTVSLTIVPAAPAITSPTAVTTQAGAAFSYQIAASNDPTGFSATGLPAGLTLNTGNGLIAGTPATTGTYPINVGASNAGGSATLTLTLTVTAANVPPSAPNINSPTTAAATVGVAFTYTITASNGPTSYGASGLPAGLTLAPASGVISGAPTTAGTFPVTLTATNGTGTDTALVTITVNPAPVPAPVISSATAVTTQIGQAFSYQITASDNPTGYAAINLPAGLGVNTATGLVSGTPTTAGVFMVSLSATNSGGTGMITLNLTVNAAPVVAAPVITSTASVTTQVGAAFTYAITASNAPTGFGASGLPGGLTVNPATGLISGTPTAPGTYAVNLSAANSGGTGTTALSLTVAAAPVIAPVVNSAASATATGGQPFTYQITATNTPASFGASGLPDGLTVDSTTGLITGAPTMAGNYPVTLIATNDGGTGAETLTLVVTQVVPVVTLTAPVPTVAEGSGLDGEFDLTFSAPTTVDLVVSFTIGGTGVNGVDYTAIKTTKKIPAGKTGKPIKITPLLTSGGKQYKRTVVLTLQPGSGYTVGTTDKVKVKIFGN